MLVAMRIENFALIDQLEIDFSPGLNVLSGETGAGKSIIIDAVNMVMGGRSSGDFIRSGADKAILEAVFQLKDLSELSLTLEELGLEEDDENTLILSRIISQNGKNTYRINGRSATLGMFKEVAQWLVDIHGQHDSQMLIKPGKHLALLDGFAQNEIKPILVSYKATFQDWQSIKAKLEQFQQAEKDRARKIDMLQFQINELTAAKLTANEDVALAEEQTILANSGKLATLASLVYQDLKAGNRQSPAALDVLSEVVKNLKEIATIDDKVLPLTEVITEAFYQLEDAADQIRAYQEKLFIEPKRLEQIEDRLDFIRQLKRKYGNSIQEINLFLSEAQTELQELINNEQFVEELQARLASKYQELLSLGEKLTLLRCAGAQRLQDAITAELADLSMPQVKFKVHIEKLQAPKSSGLDEVEFFISPNPGEPLKPLSKIASGGELSRIMLAMKVILAQSDETPTLIFDEVDAGVGGRAAQAIGEKLAKLGHYTQILCVTHSPQVTSFADNHLMIAKVVQDNRTMTVVTVLDSDAREMELARMLGGVAITQTTMDHAAEMIESANRLKAL